MYRKGTQLFTRIASYSCQILMTLESSGQNFEKSASIKFQKNPYTRSRVILRGQTDERTDKHDEANSCFSQFFEPSFCCSFYFTENTS